MTINIAVAVAEGLVMAADSYSQMSEADGQVVATHTSVEKLTEIGDLKMAVMIHGLGSLENRTILSLIREFEFIKYSEANVPIRSAKVWEVAHMLAAFVNARYEQAYPPPVAGADDDRPSLGLIVGGYSPGVFFPEVVEIEFPGGNALRTLPSDRDSQPDGGWYVNFWGVRVSLKRLLFGFDFDSLTRGYGFLEYAQAQRDAGNAAFASAVDAPPIHPVDALKDLQGWETMPHRLDGMPLQEGVEFADFLGTVAIGYDKFTSGPPSVGGDLDVLAIQPEGLCWYRRKPFAASMARARRGAAG